ncbi:MAG TPA: isoprenyl transferase, partial [Rhodospirillales bacterium]|nr:isoprenyl transferase [Rhodospirillales bacterium]
MPERRRRVPRHVAIIMDGNGRWARARGLPRSAGHRAGVEAVRRTVRAAQEMGIEVLTLYSFSSENWTRPKGEISYLFSLLRRFVQRDVADLHARNVRVRIIGERAGLEDDIVGLLEHCERLTAANTGLTVVFAFNYGGRQEIAAAARRLAAEVAAGRLDPAAITPEALATRLYAPDLPEPDLVIRTSNEKRLSNFLLWQAAYAELVFVPEYWPDFSAESLAGAIAEYAARERR